MSAFMDHAETLGLRPILAMVAAHYAGRWDVPRKGDLCSCVPSPLYAMTQNRRILSMATHDLTCPAHRVVVICGSPEDRIALVERAHEFALDCVRILDAPARELVEDFEFAKSIIEGIRHD